MKWNAENVGDGRGRECTIDNFKSVMIAWSRVESGERSVKWRVVSGDMCERARVPAGDGEQRRYMRTTDRHSRHHLISDSSFSWYVDCAS